MARGSQWTQLGWLLWKNSRLKARNWKSTLKEVAFPLYTFGLVALLKISFNMADLEPPTQW
ncbi:hypothetical protein T484DRAFT_1768470 [Baffinella frigidus]|nr:hypothetical protein T484DRAFT_1768470 [Cryptophyta sp. CCMP2293]